MTQAKQKAFELKERFDGYLDYAEKAVDEIISSHNKWDDIAQTNTEEYYYYKEVKKELQNL
jgi:hypothetical protein